MSPHTRAGDGHDPDPRDGADEAFAALQAADPARGARGDLDSLRARVQRRIDAEPADDTPTENPASGGAATGDGAGRERPTAERTRASQRRHWVVAAAFLGALAIGTGGYVAGSLGPGSGSDLDSAGSADEAQDADRGYDDSAADTEQAEPGSDGDGDDADEELDAPETFDSSEESAAPSPQTASGQAQLGRYEFIDGGLPDVASVGEVWFSGPDADRVSLGNYPLVSAAEAIGRLGDPQYALPWVTDVDSPPADPGGAPVPEPGADLPWPVVQVRLVDAELGVAAYERADGGTFSLPTWYLIDDRGGRWPVMAVAAGSLDVDGS